MELLSGVTGVTLSKRVIVFKRMQSENQSVSDRRDNRRLAMKLFPVHPIAWSSFLILWALLCKTEGNNSHDCEEEGSEEVIVRGSSVEEHSEEKHMLNETFSCYLYPTNILNCSWSFHTLQNDTQLSVYISICDDRTATHSWNHSHEEKAGSWSWSLHESLPSHVVIQFNMSLHNSWTSYTCAYDTVMIEVLPPPSNISASVKDGRLLVAWGLPASRIKNPECFEYELDLGDKERIESLKEQLSYTELNDPTRTYRVRIRAKTTGHCHGAPQWSDWSHTITVEQSVSKLNVLVIISISLGIPMILLAVLLLVRHQRVSKILFPPIPRPPPKYIYFLEKNDAPSFFYPAQATKAEEEITEVEDTEENAVEVL